MNPTDFSVLLLAWDDADPGVAVLGGSALPPTLPLVYQLATQHPVLAVYPHLPAGEATAALESSVPIGAAAGAGAPVVTAAAFAAGSAEAFAFSGPLEAAVDAPGVHLLAPAVAAGSRLATPAGGSRLVGLDDLLPTIQGALPTSHSLTLAPGVAPGGSAAAARSQWPANSGPLRAATWQAPAAPYAGAAEADADVTVVPFKATVRVSARVREAFPPTPPRPEVTPSPSEAGAADEASEALEALAAADTSASSTATANPSPDYAHPTAVSDAAVPVPFDEPVEEMGAAEARDLDAPEDDLVPDAAPPVATAAATAAVPATPVAAPEPVAAWAVRQPTLDGLNFRMIQYARRAAQLVDGRRDFGVIYAPGWPAWLAALEIRNRSGRPLVLYLPALPSATAPAAERGWLLGLERMTLRRATLVLVPDAEVLRQLRAHHADALGEVRIVPAADEAAVQRVLAEVALG